MYGWLGVQSWRCWAWSSGYSLWLWQDCHWLHALVKTIHKRKSSNVSIMALLFFQSKRFTYWPTRPRSQFIIGFTLPTFRNTNWLYLLWISTLLYSCPMARSHVFVVPLPARNNFTLAPLPSLDCSCYYKLASDRHLSYDLHHAVNTTKQQLTIFHSLAETLWWDSQIETNSFAASLRSFSDWYITWIIISVPLVICALLRVLFLFYRVRVLTATVTATHFTLHKVAALEPTLPSFLTYFSLLSPANFSTPMVSLSPTVTWNLSFCISHLPCWHSPSHPLGFRQVRVLAV